MLTLEEHQTSSELLTLFMETMAIDNDVWLKWKTFSCGNDNATLDAWVLLKNSPLAKEWPMLCSDDDNRRVIEMYPCDLRTEEIEARLNELGLAVNWIM